MDYFPRRFTDRRKYERSRRASSLVSYGKIGLLIIFSTFYIRSAAQTAQMKKVSSATAREWMKRGAWRDGLTEKPDRSINAKIFYTQYHLHKAWWDKAFAFLNRKDLAALAPGNYPIVGKDVFASVSEYVPRDFNKTQWESHRKYADIQCMIRGEEKIGQSPVSKLTVTVPYKASTDGANYTGPGKYYLAKPGTFFIFFPGEGHRPNILAKKGDTEKVKKIVIKMRVTM